MDLEQAVVELRVRWVFTDHLGHAFIEGVDQSICGEAQRGPPLSGYWCQTCRRLMQDTEFALDLETIHKWPIPPGMYWSDRTICRNNMIVHHSLPCITWAYWKVWEEWSRKSDISRDQYLRWTAPRLYVLCNNDFPHSVWDNKDAAKKEMQRLNAEDEKQVAEDPHSYGTRRIFYHLNTVPFRKL